MLEVEAESLPSIVLGRRYIQTNAIGCYWPKAICL
jgi:hypothetical protein